MNFYKIVPWIVIVLAGTLYINFLGIKKNWHELRIKNGLEKNKHCNPPKLGQKNNVCKFGYSKICIFLFIVSLCLSFLIAVIFYLSSDNNEITFKNVTSILVSIFSLYAFIVEAPVDKNMKFEDESKLPFDKIFSLITPVKNYIIEGFVNSEYQHKIDYIKSCITQWYNKNDKELGTLIIRIDSDFFNKMLPDGKDEEIKELLRQESYNILKLYSEDKPFIDELIKLLTRTIMQYNANLQEVTEFIYNNKIESKRQSMEKIKQYVSVHILPDKIHGKKQLVTEKSIEEVIKGTIQEQNIEHA